MNKQRQKFPLSRFHHNIKMMQNNICKNSHILCTLQDTPGGYL